MPFSPTQLAAIAAALLFASIIQSAVGFGIGLFAIPILLACGIDLPYAIAIVLAGSFVTSGTATLKLRREVPWPAVGAATALRSVGMIAGVCLLGMITTLDVARVKQLIGAVLLIVVIGQWLGKVQPRERLAWPWSVTAFLASGVMAGTVGMGGPPLVLWVMAHRWSAVRTRAFLLGCLFMLEPLLILALAWRFGSDALIAAGVGLLALPILLAGTAVGLRLGRRISRTRLQSLAFVMLLILALASLAGPWLSM